MTGSYHRLNKVVTLIAVAMISVVTLPEQVNKASATWYAAIDLANAVLVIPIRKEDQKQFTFTWDE